MAADEIWKLIGLVTLILLVSAGVGVFAWLTGAIDFDQRFRRLLGYVGALLYSAGAICGTVEVLTKRAPASSLIGLPLSLIFIWASLKMAKMPPR